MDILEEEHTKMITNIKFTIVLYDAASLETLTHTEFKVALLPPRVALSSCWVIYNTMLQFQSKTFAGPGVVRLDAPRDLLYCISFLGMQKNKTK